LASKKSNKEKGALTQKDFGRKRKIIGGENLYGLTSKGAQPGHAKRSSSLLPWPFRNQQYSRGANGNETGKQTTKHATHHRAVQIT
jgi:hypothetical protein